LQTTFEPREVPLRDGRTVRVRPILPTDEDELLQAFDRMKPEARYMRFMSSIRHANVDRLHKVLASFPEKGFAVGATIPAPDGIDIVGTASFMVEGDGGSCEFAISIMEEWGGVGLGRRLMEELIGVARRRGLARMRGFVLAINQPMLRLASRLGFKVSADPEDLSIRIVSLEL
jgi:RimJ/RimL family protein N-acetyltransferase